MQNIIKVTTNEIGNAELNSVNAREIHKYLGVKTKFSMWIDRAIKKYDFVENVDYVLLPIFGKQKNGSGGHNQKDYIVTVDMGKELAMLENNAKGKEVRKYFISCEKKVLSGNLVNSELTQVVIEFIKNQQSTNEMIINLFKEFATALKDNQNFVRETISESAVDIRIIEEKLSTKNIGDTLTPDMLDEIKKEIDKKASQLSKKHNISKADMTRLLYGKVNSALGVDTYYKIEYIHFDKALHFIRSMELVNGSGNLAIVN